jgi:DNA-binding NarL/FixJ family response regulator
MLKARGKFTVVAQANDGEQLLALLKNHTADVVIMDLAMPNLNGVQTLEKLKEFGSNVPVLVLSADEGERNVRAALKAGARGYIPKNAGVEELEFAINAILEGKTYLSPGITEQLMARQAQGLPENPLSVLTNREIEILKHLADGKPNRDIGKLLHISTRTVDTHRSNILKKLKVKTNAELVKMAITHELISV